MVDRRHLSPERRRQQHGRARSTSGARKYGKDAGNEDDYVEVVLRHRRSCSTKKGQHAAGEGRREGDDRRVEGARLGEELAAARRWPREYALNGRRGVLRRRRGTPFAIKTPATSTNVDDGEDADPGAAEADPRRCARRPRTSTSRSISTASLEASMAAKVRFGDIQYDRAQKIGEHPDPEDHPEQRRGGRGVRDAARRRRSRRTSTRRKRHWAEVARPRQAGRRVQQVEPARAREPRARVPGSNTRRCARSSCRERRRHDPRTYDSDRIARPRVYSVHDPRFGGSLLLSLRSSPVAAAARRATTTPTGGAARRRQRSQSMNDTGDPAWWRRRRRHRWRRRGRRNGGGGGAGERRRRRGSAASRAAGHVPEPTIPIRRRPRRRSISTSRSRSTRSTQPTPDADACAARGARSARRSMRRTSRRRRTSRSPTTTRSSTTPPSSCSTICSSAPPAKQNANVYYVYGLVYDKTNRPEQAVLAYQKAVELNPNFASALVNLGVHQLSNKQYGEAQATFEKLTQRDGPQRRGHADVARLGVSRPLGGLPGGLGASATSSSLRPRRRTSARSRRTRTTARPTTTSRLLYLDADPFPSGGGTLDTLQRLNAAKALLRPVQEHAGRRHQAVRRAHEGRRQGDQAREKKRARSRSKGGDDDEVLRW